MVEPQGAGHNTQLPSVACAGLSATRVRAHGDPRWSPGPRVPKSAGPRVPGSPGPRPRNEHVHLKESEIRKSLSELDSRWS